LDRSIENTLGELKIGGK